MKLTSNAAKGETFYPFFPSPVVQTACIYTVNMVHRFLFTAQCPFGPTRILDQKSKFSAPLVQVTGAIPP